MNQINTYKNKHYGRENKNVNHWQQTEINRNRNNEKKITEKIYNNHNLQLE